jgi:hypothetical protein
MSSVLAATASVGELAVIDLNNEGLMKGLSEWLKY